MEAPSRIESKPHAMTFCTKRHRLRQIGIGGGICFTRIAGEKYQVLVQVSSLSLSNLNLSHNMILFQVQTSLQY